MKLYSHRNAANKRKYDRAPKNAKNYDDDNNYSDDYDAQKKSKKGKETIG